MHPDVSTLVLQIINFAILVWLLQRFLYRPVLRMIDARRVAIEQQQAQAKAAEDKAKAELKALAGDRAGIAVERQTVLKLAADQAQAAAEVRRAQVESEAQALLDNARKTLAAERDQALAEARAMALDLGADFAQRLIAQLPQEPLAEACIERIEQHLRSLPPSQRQELVQQASAQAAITVATATALPAALADAWRSRLHAALGSDATFAFTVDPALIAGAELHFPNAVLRYSWQSALADARAEIGTDVHAG